MSRLGRANGERIITICAFCKAPKETSSSSRKFCSRKCYELNKRNFSNCGYCSQRYRNPKNTRCCSRSCAQRLRPRKRGYHISEEHRRKIADAQRGEKGNNWKGGVYTSQPQAERKSARYRTLRKEVMERDGWQCVLCSQKGYLEVDHILSYSKHPDLRFVKENLRTLCKSCHKQTPTFSKG